MIKHTVITGAARGRKLISFENPSDGCRATADFVKQAVFNIIQFDIEGRRALDLFAGTGQLGIEALSRGAAWADFVDTDTSVVKRNLEITGFTGKAGVIRACALTFIKSSKDRYDLIFLDPPYASDLLNQALLEIYAIDILRSGGIIICEGKQEPDAAEGYVKSKYVYSGKIITLLRRVT